MRLEIFNVEHGQCALLTDDSGNRMLIDCGHNSTTGWRPSLHLRRLGVDEIDALIITNSDEDHASDLHNLRREVRIKALYRNKTVSGTDLYHLKGQDGPGDGIAALCDMIGTYTHPLSKQPDFEGLSIKTFRNAYPADFDDENNLSLVTILRWPNFAICFPGDMERAGWLKLLEQPAFRTEISNMTIFVASHHGRENGCCEELYKVTGLNPYLTIISDGGKQYATQETVNWYASRTIGIDLYGRKRKVLTTRSDGDISIDITSTAVTVSTSTRA